MINSTTVQDSCDNIEHQDAQQNAILFLKSKQEPMKSRLLERRLRFFRSALAVTLDRQDKN